MLAVWILLALVFDALVAAKVAEQAAERGEDGLTWGVLTFVFPFLGFRLLSSAVEGDDERPDMSVVTRELQRRRRPPAPPATAISSPEPPTERRVKRPRNYF